MDSLLSIVVLGAVAAGFVQGLSGFGFSLVAMSFWAWALDPRLAASLAVFGSLTGQIIAALTVRRGFDLRRLLPFVMGGLAGIPLGIQALPHLDIGWFKVVLGSLLAVWCPLMLLARRLPRIERGGRMGDAMAGAAGGIMGGLGGFTGALPTLWCTLRGFDKDTQRAIVQNFNLSMLAVTMAGYLLRGIVTADMLPLFGVVGLAVLIPVLLGARIYTGLSEAAFRNIVLGLLTISGMALLLSGVLSVTGRT